MAGMADYYTSLFLFALCSVRPDIAGERMEAKEYRYGMITSLLPKDCLFQAEDIVAARDCQASRKRIVRAPSELNPRRIH